MDEELHIQSYNYYKHPDSVHNAYTSTYKWASLAPVYKDEKGRHGHRRWLSTLTGRRAYLEVGYEPVASLAVKRGVQLKKETNEECGFVFLHDEEYMEFFSGAIVREAEENGKIMASNANRAAEDDKRLRWPQSHLEISPVPLLLGCQLPKRPMLHVSTIPAFGVWGAVPNLQTMKDSEGDRLWIKELDHRTRHLRDSYVEMAAPSSIWKFLSRSLSFATGSSNYSANLEKEKENISKIIRHEFDSSPAFRNVS